MCEHDECPYKKKCTWHPEYDPEEPRGHYIWWEPGIGEDVEFCTGYLDS